MARDWEIFDIGPRDAENNLHVTLGSKGNLMIGCAAFRRLGKPDAAMLMYERESGLIGIRPAHRRAEHSYPMKLPQRGGHRVLRVSRFCKYHGIKVDQTVRFRSACIEDGVLVLDTRSMVNMYEKAHTGGRTLEIFLAADNGKEDERNETTEIDR